VPGLFMTLATGGVLAQASTTDTVMDGVAIISQGPSVWLRWSLPDDTYLPGSFTLTRTDEDGTQRVITVASPLPFEESGVDFESYEAAVAVFGPPVPEAEQVWDDEEQEDEPVEDDPMSLALVRAFFEL